MGAMLDLFRLRVYPYFRSAAPDGEWARYQESVRADPELAEEARRAYKGTFTGDYVARLEKEVAHCGACLPLTFVDVGGKLKYNDRICRTASHAILLAANPDDLEEWRAMFASIEVEILAEIRSDYHGRCDTVPVPDAEGVLRGTVHRLERGEDVSSRPTILKLAEEIGVLCKQERGGDMGTTYSIVSSTRRLGNQESTHLDVTFGEEATNDRIVRDASNGLEELKLAGGKLALIYGPASLPVMVVLAHGLCHLYGAVGVFDPKMASYVISSSHDPDYPLGMLIPHEKILE